MTQNKKEHYKCPLCYGQKVSDYWQDKYRVYLECKECSLVFVPPQYHLSAEEEKKQYDFHQNSPNDMNYRKFLNRLFQPMQKYIIKGDKGLDFGCGPGPTLSVMFQEIGCDMNIYDKFYADHPGLLQQNYTFITATEVLEHLSDAKYELERLLSCLKSGGVLGIMTKLLTNKEAFKTWHYKNDPTHICFYSKTAFQWLAEHWQAGIEFHGNDVIIIRKHQQLS